MPARKLRNGDTWLQFCQAHSALCHAALPSWHAREPVDNVPASSVSFRDALIQLREGFKILRTEFAVHNIDDLVLVETTRQHHVMISLLVCRADTHWRATRRCEATLVRTCRQAVAGHLRPCCYTLWCPQRRGWNGHRWWRGGRRWCRWWRRDIAISLRGGTCSISARGTSSSCPGCCCSGLRSWNPRYTIRGSFASLPSRLSSIVDSAALVVVVAVRVSLPASECADARSAPITEESERPSTTGWRAL